MEEIYFRLSDLDTPEKLHDAFTEALHFPDYYGRNLDALHDELTDLTEDTKILLDFEECDEEELPSYTVKMLQVLRDSAEENTNLFIEEI
ncbi:MAG TPA: barstar family protein [Lachnospiraceae bacterium]|nr:barstar family protein [Lachnospiraceae bacterium]